MTIEQKELLNSRLSRNAYLAQLNAEFTYKLASFATMSNIEDICALQQFILLIQRIDTATYDTWTYCLIDAYVPQSAQLALF
jgi:hypothetical protein